MTPHEILDSFDQIGRLLAEVQRDVQRMGMLIRRLRAAEGPGTDDVAFEGTGWRSATEGRPYWHHPSGWVVKRDSYGLPCAIHNAAPTVYGPAHTLADLMEQVVPGSLTQVP